MKFTLTPSGANSITNALKNVMSLPALLAATKASSDAKLYSALFGAQTNVARQRMLDSATKLNDQ